MAKSNESKREEYRKYLEKGGVLDALTKTLIELYEEPEKKNDPLAFTQKTLTSPSVMAHAVVNQLGDDLIYLPALMASLEQGGMSPEVIEQLRTQMLQVTKGDAKAIQEDEELKEHIEQLEARINEGAQ